METKTETKKLRKTETKLKRKKTVKNKTWNWKWKIFCNLNHTDTVQVWNSAQIMAKFGISWSQCVIGQWYWCCCVGHVVKSGEDVVGHIDHRLVLIRNCMQQPSAHGGVEGMGRAFSPWGGRRALGPPPLDSDHAECVINVKSLHWWCWPWLCVWCRGIMSPQGYQCQGITHSAALFFCLSQLLTVTSRLSPLTDVTNCGF